MMTSTMPMPNDSLVLSIASRPSVGPTLGRRLLAQRRRQRAGLQHVDEVVALLLLALAIAPPIVIVARPPRIAPWMIGAPDLVVEDDRHLLADDLRGEIAEDAAAEAVELDQHDRAVRVGVVDGLRVRRPPVPVSWTARSR